MSNALADCPTCKGYGAIQKAPARPFPDDPYYADEKPCETCSGKGQVPVSVGESYSPEPEERYAATYADTYDGAPDSGNRSHIGYGPTEAAAIADLLDNYEP